MLQTLALGPTASELWITTVLPLSGDLPQLGAPPTPIHSVTRRASLQAQVPPGGLGQAGRVGREGPGNPLGLRGSGSCSLPADKAL